MIHISRQSKSISRQMVLYAAVAAIGLVVDFMALYILKECIGLHYLIATSGGFILGLVVTYFLSNWVVFGQPHMNPKMAFFLFGIIGLAGLGILNLLVWFFTDILNIYYLLSKAIATVFVFFWNFFARRTLYSGAGSIDTPKERG